jgi:UDP-perosamine 4-acetyltransferase
VNGLVLIGGGGHAKVVIDAALRSGVWNLLGVLDDSPRLVGCAVLGIPVIGVVDTLRDKVERSTKVIVAVGCNNKRYVLQERVRAAGFRLATVTHPSAVVASSVELGIGSVVMAGAMINADSKLGEGVIVNTGAIVDHDCVIGDFVHLGPGVALCGGVQIGARSLIGVGAAVIPGISIGRDCMVGAGATVTRVVSNSKRVVGTPAREV